jgi:hypothetical protein
MRRGTRLVFVSMMRRCVCLHGQVCAVIRLSARYFAATSDAAPFSNPDWEAAMTLIVDTMVEQQKGSDEDREPVYQVWITVRFDWNSPCVASVLVQK